MRNLTVRARTIIAFSAVIITMLVFGGFSLSQLGAIENDTAELLLHIPKADTSHGAVATAADGGAAADAAAIYRSVSSLKSAVLGALGLCVFLGLIAGYILVQGINRPLGQVVQAMEVIRTGDFSDRLLIGGHDEFTTLAHGFNRMSDDLTTLVRQVQQAGEQVSASAAAIATTARQQQTTASEIATTTTQIGVTSNEISATSKQLARTMSEVAGVAESTADLAAGGQAGLGRMNSTMQQILEASGSINARLGVLNERASNINTVVTTITKVADQTNLLSLNAAIEAEKAGEYGRGFGVVASEIRRLADQTAIATYDIEQMVKEMQSAVGAGVMGMDKFSEQVRRGAEVVTEVGEQLGQIIERVQALTPRFEVVKEGMEAQATGAQQISEALGQLGEAVQETVESLAQSQSTISQLNGAASALNGGVSRFVLKA